MSQPLYQHRMGDPDEFGRSLAWLLSDVACRITGQNIFIDGGRMQTPF